MLRTSLRSPPAVRPADAVSGFLSSNAQDFIEERKSQKKPAPASKFLSSNAQDFIEEIRFVPPMERLLKFLSSNAQDFIEDADDSR